MRSSHSPCSLRRSSQRIAVSCNHHRSGEHRERLRHTYGGTGAGSDHRPRLASRESVSAALYASLSARVLLIGILLVVPRQAAIDRVQVHILIGESYDPDQPLPAVTLGDFMSRSRSLR